MPRPLGPEIICDLDSKALRICFERHRPRWRRRRRRLKRKPIFSERGRHVGNRMASPVRSAYSPDSKVCVRHYHLTVSQSEYELGIAFRLVTRVRNVPPPREGGKHLRNDAASPELILPRCSSCFWISLQSRKWCTTEYLPELLTKFRPTLRHVLWCPLA